VFTLSEPHLPRAIVAKIIGEVRADPQSREVLIATYLPFLVNYVAPLLYTNKMMFAQFKLYFTRQWQVVFPDIPVPDFEGVFNYDTMINKFYEHLLEYRDRVYARLGLRGIKSGAELERAVKFVLMDILYTAVIGVLRFRGEV
jgi:hypothetical protein